MATRNVTLPEQLDQFIDAEIARGKYQNASEVMLAGLVLLEQQAELDRNEGIPLLDDLALETFLEGFQPPDQ